MDEKAESFEAFNAMDHSPLPVIVEMEKEKAESFKWNAKEPLGRGKGEKGKPNAALNDYYMLGAGRSLRRLCALYRERHQSASEGAAETGLPPTRRLRTLFGWSARYHWQERVEAAQAEAEAERRRIRLERQIKVDDEDWTLGSELRNLAHLILAEGPKYLKTTRRFIAGAKQTVVGADGKTYTVQVEPDREIITVALNAPVAIRAAKVASDMQREAAGTKGRDRRESWHVDLATLTIDQLTRLAAGEDLINVLLAPGGDSGTGAATEIS